MLRYIKEDCSKQLLNIKNKLGTSASRYKFIEKYFLLLAYTFAISSKRLCLQDLRELFSLPKEGFDVSVTQRQLDEEHDCRHTV